MPQRCNEVVEALLHEPPQQLAGAPEWREDTSWVRLESWIFLDDREAMERRGAEDFGVRSFSLDAHPLDCVLIDDVRAKLARLGRRFLGGGRAVGSVSSILGPIFGVSLVAVRAIRVMMRIGGFGRLDLGIGSRGQYLLEGAAGSEV